ncbi:MAG: hypothetical protein EU521_01990 [Promethearchaeota archaeon]|nr:MAG: hypothetical protein EU521_01990 [Candidatus Lokiarchaeota archaeon]
MPIIIFSFGILIFRTFLKIVENFYIKRNDYNIAGSIFIIIALVFGIIFFSLPTMELGGIQIYQIWSIIFTFFGFILIGLFVFIYGKIKVGKNPTNYIMFRPQKVRIGILVAVIVVIILIPTIFSGFLYLNIGNREVWFEQEWQRKYKREIEWTRATAGLDMFEERPISNFTLSANTSDNQIITNIRQYDQNFSVNYLAAQIGSSFEALADSDIVYFDGVEYWVAPKTIKTTQFSNDPQVVNTELYDHIEGFLAMDTFSRTIVNNTDVFNISENYPIFFGESQSSRYGATQIYGAYDPNILLGTNYSQGIPKNNFKYEGDPDGSLTGLENFWYTFNLGLLGYATRPTNDFLINRNIRTRVAGILLPNLQLDYDPYLVFDSARGKMYYAVSIFTNIYIGSYARYPILRFLGICLIDVKTGEMDFYRNHMLETTTDPTYPLWKIYYSQTTYPWQDPPEWLKKQIRYPETLFEIQLRANYRYHVQDAQTWLRQDDFHERPEDGDLFYIETDVGDGIEYAGIDLVEYVGREANLLAGMYVIRHGANLGEAIFYHTREITENLIGPKTARDTYSSDATYEISLIQGARNGNTLLYPLGNSIYFYVPTYSTTGTLQQLKLAGFVEAFTREVGYGFDVYEAYENLGISPPGSFTLTADTDEPDFDFDGNFTLTWTPSQNVQSYSIYRSNTTINEINENVTLVASNITTTSYSITSEINGTLHYIVRAINNYGSILSNSIQITVEIPPPISYQIDIEDSINLPDDLASFRILLENYNTNFSAPGYNVKVNLTLYRAGEGDYAIIMPPSYYPLENTTYIENNFNGTTFTLINVNLTSGEGRIINGFINWTLGYGEIFFRYRLELIIDEIVYHTEEGLINVFA